MLLKSLWTPTVASCVDRMFVQTSERWQMKYVFRFCPVFLFSELFVQWVFVQRFFVWCQVSFCPEFLYDVQWVFVQRVFVKWVFIQWAFVQWVFMHRVFCPFVQRVFVSIQWAFVERAFVKWIFVQRVFVHCPASLCPVSRVFTQCPVSFCPVFAQWVCVWWVFV